MGSNLYHSKLVEICDGKPLQVVVKTDRLKSKYSKPGNPKPDYVGLFIEGAAYSYTTENEACAAALTGLKGKTVSIIATGSREDAAIVVVGQSGAQTPPPQQRQPDRQQPAPERQEAAGNARTEAFQQAHGYMARNCALAKMAIQATVATANEFNQVFGEPMPEAMMAELMRDCLFGINNACAHGDLPMVYTFKPVGKQ